MKSFFCVILYFASIGLLGVINVGAYLDSISTDKELRNKILLATFISVIILGIAFKIIFENYIEKKSKN